MKSGIIFLFFVLFSFCTVAQVAVRIPVTDSQLVKARKIRSDGKLLRNPEEGNLGFQISKNLQVIADKYKGMQSDSVVWIKMKTDAYNYLYNLWTAQKLIGTKANEAFFVKTGKEVTTLQEIAEGKKVLQAGYAQYKPAEFTILRIESQ